jgi:hypothetical protein
MSTLMHQRSDRFRVQYHSIISQNKKLQIQFLEYSIGIISQINRLGIYCIFDRPHHLYVHTAGNTLYID